jgi:hypothetical protein
MKLLKKKYLYGVGIKSEGSDGIYNDSYDLIVSVSFRMPFREAHKLYNKLSKRIKEAW